MNRLVKTLLGVFVIGGVLLLPGIASAQHCDPYPLCSDSGFVSDSTPRRGQTITFSYIGGHGLPGATFQVSIIRNFFAASKARPAPFVATIGTGLFTRQMAALQPGQSRQLTTGVFDGNGNFSVRVTIPSDLGPGAYTLRAVGPSRTGGQLTVSAGITISAEAPLIPTGSNTIPWLLVGLGSVVVGSTFVGVARRRRSEPAPAL